MSTRLRPGARRAMWFVAALVLLALAATFVFEVRTPPSADLPPPSPFAQPARIDTVAGDGVRGHVDGPRAQVRFDDPFGVALDAAGLVYVAEGGDGNREFLLGARKA